MKRQPTNRVPSLWATAVKETPRYKSPAGAGRSRTENGVFTLWIANAGDPVPDLQGRSTEQPFFRDDVRVAARDWNGVFTSPRKSHRHTAAQLQGLPVLRNSLRYQTLRIFFRADGSARGVNVAMRLKSMFRRELCRHPQDRLQHRRYRLGSLRSTLRTRRP
jgi:hypothetical protein